MRSIALPSECQASLSFEGCYDLLKLFGSQQNISDALRSRFDGLPIHQLCYYHSYYPTDVTIDQIKSITTEQNEASSLNKQDCLGMMPLHILACSSKQNLDLYQFIIARYPNSLITEDKWGCLPVLYAILSDAPQEIIQLLINSQKSTFPDHILDWDKMLETLCRVGASLDNVQRLFHTQQASFSDQSIDWQKAARELTICFFSMQRDYSMKVQKVGEDIWRAAFFEDWLAMAEALSASGLHQLIRGLIETQQRFFADGNNANLQVMCEELVKPLDGWWKPRNVNDSMKLFRFLVKCNIAERQNVIGVRKWRMEIKQLVEGLPSPDSSCFGGHCSLIHSKLATYELEYPKLKNAAFLLELALWKSKIDEQMVDDTIDWRGQCRVNCGGDVIIPNVLPYIITSPFSGLNESSTEEDSDEDENSDNDASDDGGNY